LRIKIENVYTLKNIENGPIHFPGGVQVLLMCFLVELFVKKDYMGIDLM
jgi:hypothetical protein